MLNWKTYLLKAQTIPKKKKEKNIYCKYFEVFFQIQNIWT